MGSDQTEYVMAPRKATEHMVEQARMTLPGPVDICDADIEDIYETMLAAAPSVTGDREPTYDDLLAELATCRDLATAASGHDDSAAIADPLQVAAHVGLALGIPPEHRRSGDREPVAWRWRVVNSDTWVAVHRLPVPGGYFNDDVVVGRDVIVEPLYSAPVEDRTAAARDVLAERQRQVEAEGWTPEHDDEHDDGQMGRAAVAYIMNGHPLTEYKLVPVLVPSGARSAGDPTYAVAGHRSVPKLWPWYGQWWKPKDRRRDLVRAAALLIAEIERLDRASQEKGEA